MVRGYHIPLQPLRGRLQDEAKEGCCISGEVVVVVNHCFTSLFGTKGLLNDIVTR